MRRVFSVIKLWFAGMVLSVGLISQGVALEVGQLAPAFSLQNQQGKQVSLAEFRGKLVVLEWTNHECPFVKKHYGSNNMQSLQKKYTAKGVVWLSIVSSAPDEQGHIYAEQAVELTAARGAHPSAVLLDPAGEVGHAYAAVTTPHMFIVDKQGVLVYQGAIDSIRSTDAADIKKATNYVAVGLDAVLSGKPVVQPVTRSYGCSIKYKPEAL